MKIIYDLIGFSAIKPVVTIGTFDGIHLGHQKVLTDLKNTAAEINGKSVVFTFLQHPRSVLFPEDTSLSLLTSFNEKAEFIEKIGIDYLIAFPFTYEFSQLKSDDFIRKYLVDIIKLNTLVIGYDHQFGKGREGGEQNHQLFAEQFGYNFHTVGAYQVNNENVSSTKIRNFLQQGNIVNANSYLGRPYAISGTVLEGQKLGRQLGFPTANIQPDDKLKLLPADGVYAVKVEYDKNIYKGMLNIGVRPSVNSESKRSVEVNIFDFSQDIYMKNIKVIFYERMRNEQKFESLEKLKLQLLQDQLYANEFLSRI